MRIPFFVASAVLALSILVLPAHAQVDSEASKLTSSDGFPHDYFGTSIAVDSDIAIVGVPYDDDKGMESGSAYVYDISNPQDPIELRKLLASDGFGGDGFGSSVAIDGRIAVVSAPLKSWDRGAAYVFDITTGTELYKFLPTDAQDHDVFGCSVAISGTTVLVGMKNDDDKGWESGSAYLFSTVTGQQLAKILASDGDAYDLFGSSVSLSGNSAIIGAKSDDALAPGAGSAYIYDISDPFNPVESHKLFAFGGASGDRFGSCVALSGSTAIVGAPESSMTGAAYLFDTISGNQITRLSPSDLAVGDRFGRSVALDGTMAIVGMPGQDDNGADSGSAYVFDTTTGAQIRQLQPSDGWENDGCGTAVALAGSTVTVVSNQDDDHGTNSGSAYVFDLGEDCNGNGVPDSDDIANGTSQDCNGNGRPDECDLADDPASDWNGDGVLDACSSPNYCQSTGAVMRAAGSPLIAENDFTLLASGLPPHEFGYFLMSDTQGFVPGFGGSLGTLCLGGTIYRFIKPPTGGILNSGPTGEFQFTADLTNLPQGVVFNVGESWYFQAWFRQVFSSNTTDGIEVMFR